MKFAICDDEKQQLDSISSALKKYLGIINEQNFSIVEFSEPLDLLEKMNSGEVFDVVFLDVIMPSLSGVELARIIRSKKYDSEIVFVTSSNDYAIEAFDVGAVHYVLKPIRYHYFEDAMDRLFKKIFNSVEKQIILKSSSHGIQKIDIFTIEYIESFKHTQTFSFVNQKTLVVKSSLSNIFEELTAKCGNQFIMPYKGYVVNQNMIKTIDLSRIVMQSGARIPMAKGSFRRIKDAYFEYMFRKGDSN